MEEIKIVKITDQDYPDLLKKIPDAPEILYYRGILPGEHEKCFAVVGTRRPSDYGQQVTLQISRDLTNAGVTIVSGMAPGIDTFAHQACVEICKRTIAVLGTGLNEKSIYPQSNLQLSRKIIENGGCLISEYAPDEPGYASNFPERNRIVSALSLGVLVIEAKERSGSLITARLAKEQGKKLFAIPGPIYTLNSAGPNKLIKEGAILVEDANDILKSLNLATTGAQKELFAENEEEMIILQTLKEGALAVDEIIKRTKLNASTVAASVALMEISGKIRHLGGNTYSLN